MSKQDSTTNLTVAVKDYGDGTHITTQHGMRYPDGTVRWGEDKTHTDYAISFLEVAKGSSAREHWNARLVGRAQQAKIDPVVYAAGHVPLTRTVILVVTKAEEV